MLACRNSGRATPLQLPPSPPNDAFWFAIGFSLQTALIPNATAFAYFLLGWTIFTFIMLLGSLKTNVAFIGVFFFLTLTFLALTIAEFGGGTGWGQIGGWIGTITAALGAYTALHSPIVGYKRREYDARRAKSDKGERMWAEVSLRTLLRLELSTQWSHSFKPFTTLESTRSNCCSRTLSHGRTLLTIYREHE